MVYRSQIAVGQALAQGIGVFLTNPPIFSMMVTIVLWNLFAHFSGIPTLIIAAAAGLPKNLLQIAVDFLLFPFLNALVIRFVYGSFVEAPAASITENVRIVAGRYPTLLGLNAIFVVAYYIFEILPDVAKILVILPAVYLSVKLIFAYQEVVISHEDVVGALSASWDLTEGSWWRMFLLALIPELIGLPFARDPSKIVAGTVGWMSNFLLWCIVTCAYQLATRQRA